MKKNKSEISSNPNSLGFKKEEKSKAEKALKIAKEIEAKKMKNDFKYQYTNRRTRVLKHQL